AAIDHGGVAGLEGPVRHLADQFTLHEHLVPAQQFVLRGVQQVHVAEQVPSHGLLRDVAMVRTRSVARLRALGKGNYLKRPRSSTESFGAADFDTAPSGWLGIVGCSHRNWYRDRAPSSLVSVTIQLAVARFDRCGGGSLRQVRRRGPMVQVYRYLFPVMWLSWIGYWWAASRNVKITSRREPLRSRLRYFLAPTPSPALPRRATPPLPALHSRFTP